MFGLACGHFFCKGCWKGYLNLKINEEGQKANLVHCMAFKCSVIVDEGVVQQIVDHDVYNKYLRCVPHFDAYYGRRTHSLTQLSAPILRRRSPLHDVVSWRRLPARIGDIGR